jgi:lactoylglutathione lyase
MDVDSKTVDRVTEVVPFLRVSDMERSVQYYVEGLGFTITKKWVDGGKLRWCWLVKGSAAIMLQEFWKDGNRTGRPDGKLGQGVSLVFQCEDAVEIYRDVTSRGMEASEPFVGNALWTFFCSDPDGYRLEFASPTEIPEETTLSDVKGQGGS